MVLKYHRPHCHSVPMTLSSYFQFCCYLSARPRTQEWVWFDVEKLIISSLEL